MRQKVDGARVNSEQDEAREKKYARGTLYGSGAINLFTTSETALEEFQKIKEQVCSSSIVHNVVPKILVIFIEMYNRL